LFATDSADEITAANLAARFPAAVNATQFIPGNGKTLPFEQTTKDHAVATQQGSRKFLQTRIAPT
jgi:hypothetical protein